MVEDRTMALSIDVRKNRIRIHRTTLNHLGQPNFIQLLVNPNEKVLAVCGLDKRCKDAHEVKLSHINTDYSYELYSTKLVITLLSLVTNIERDGTYRLSGKVYDDKRMVLFPLNTLQRVEGSV